MSREQRTGALPMSLTLTSAPLATAVNTVFSHAVHSLGYFIAPSSSNCHLCAEVF